MAGCLADPLGIPRVYRQRQRVEQGGRFRGGGRRQIGQPLDSPLAHTSKAGTAPGIGVLEGGWRAWMIPCLRHARRQLRFEDRAGNWDSDAWKFRVVRLNDDGALDRPA